MTKHKRSLGQTMSLEINRFMGLHRSTLTHTTIEEAEQKLGIEPPVPGAPYSTRKGRMKVVYDAIHGKKTQIKVFVDAFTPKAARAFYKSYEWAQLRYHTIKHYGRVCMCCGQTDCEIHVDHIKSIRKHWHLRLDPNNVQILCRDCNYGKGSWDETDHRPDRPRIVRERL